MTGQQKRVATGLSLLIVAVAAALLAWLSFDVLRGTARGDHGSGRLFMLTVANWTGLAATINGLAIVISTALAWVGAYRLKDWLFILIVAVTVLGLICAIYLYLEFSSISTAKNFWAYSPTNALQDYDSFKSAAHRGLGSVGAWFVAVLLSELGFKKAAASHGTFQ